MTIPIAASCGVLRQFFAASRHRNFKDKMGFAVPNPATAFISVASNGVFCRFLINWDKNFNEIGLIYGIKVSIKNIAINIRACRMKYNPVKIRSFGQDNELQIGMSVILFSKSNHCLEITR